jgi:hypothetical protein
MPSFRRAKPFEVVLCITLPNASSTAWLVKFSEGIRLMKCFCRFFSYNPSEGHGGRVEAGRAGGRGANLSDDIEDGGISLFKVGSKQLEELSVYSGGRALMRDEFHEWRAVPFAGLRWTLSAMLKRQRIGLRSVACMLDKEWKQKTGPSTGLSTCFRADVYV